MKINRRVALASVAGAAAIPGLGLKGASAEIGPDPQLTPEEARSSPATSSSGACIQWRYTKSDTTLPGTG